MALQQKQLDDWCKRDMSSPAVELASESGHSCEYDHRSSGLMVDERAVEVRTQITIIPPYHSRQFTQWVGFMAKCPKRNSVFRQETNGFMQICNGVVCLLAVKLTLTPPQGHINGNPNMNYQSLTKCLY